MGRITPHAWNGKLCPVFRFLFIPKRFWKVNTARKVIENGGTDGRMGWDGWMDGMGWIDVLFVLFLFTFFSESTLF